MRLGVEETVCGGRTAWGSGSKSRGEEEVFILVTPRMGGGDRQTLPPVHLFISQTGGSSGKPMIQRGNV